MSKPTLRRVFRVTIILLAIYTIVGFLVLPPIVRSQIEKRASATLGRQVTVGSVRLNPYALSVTLNRLDVRERDGAASFLGWDRLYVRFGLLGSLFRGEWAFPAIRLEGPHVRVVVNPDGSLNFSDILARLGINASAPAAAPAAAPRPVRVGALAVAAATIDFTDKERPAPFHTTIGPLFFSLAGFRTAGDRQAPYRFTATTESGESLAWEGWIVAAPFRSAGEVNLQNIILKKYAPYYADRLRGELADGKLDVRVRYELNLDANHRVMQASDGVLHLRDLRIVEASTDKPAIELAALDVTAFGADALAAKASAGTITLTGGHLNVRREKDGAINLLVLLTPAVPPPVAAPPAAAAPVPAPSLTVGEFALRDFRVDVADLTTPRPTELQVNGVQFSLKNITLAAGASMPLALSFHWVPQGTVVVSGVIGLLPSPQADLKAEVVDFAILPLSPYLEQSLNARITQGAFSTTGRIQVAPAAAGPAVTFSGDARIEKLGLVDGARSEELAGFNSLAFDGIQVATAPQPALTIEEVTVDGPYARVAIAQDHSINLTAVMKPAGAAPAGGPLPAPVTPPAGGAVAAPAATPAAQPPQVAIRRVTLVGGDFSFVDRSLEPNVRMALSQFGGTITGLSSDNPTRADMDLQGVVGGVGRAAVTGKLDPLGPHKSVDLVVSVKGVDLQPFSPYCGKYAGYELARGKLLLDVKLQVADRKLDSADVITLDQFTFGAPTNSPDATHLPVRLGVALLKDLDGKIVIDLPIDGEIGDPNFRIGRVVIRVVVNLLTKAAVSPFALLGAMFGGGGQDLAWQEFDPGTTILRPGEDGKLVTLVKALTNRPGLSLDIEGDYDAGADAAALKRQKLADVVRRRIWEARRAVNPNVPPPDQLAVSPEEQASMLKTMFDERFPPGTALGAPVPPPAVVPPPPRRESVLRRVGKAVTFQWLRKTPPSPQQVRDYFAQAGKIAPERLFLVNGQAPGASSPAQDKGSRVMLTLR